MDNYTTNKMIPDTIKDRIGELTELVENFPEKLPADKAAKFLKMDSEVLRRAIEQGKVPVALGCDNGAHGNRYAYISTMTFYLWLMAPAIK